MLITILKQIAKRTKISFVLSNTLFFFSNLQFYVFKRDKKMLYFDFRLKNLLRLPTSSFRTRRIIYLPKTVIDKPLLDNVPKVEKIPPAFFKFSFTQRRILVRTRRVIWYATMPFLFV
jgi:hypothetical protein